MAQRLSSESSEEFSNQNNNEDDAYAEDDLPDLVLDAEHSNLRKDSNSSLEANHLDYDSTSSSVIDLLLSMTKGRRSVSSSDISHWVDAGEDEIDQFDREEVRISNDVSISL